MLGDLVATCNTKVYSALTYKGWYIGSWEEDEGDIMVLDKGNVEAGFPFELNVGAG